MEPVSVAVTSLTARPSRRDRIIMMRVAAALIACALVFALAPTAFAAPNYPELTGRIVDQANQINAADEAAILTELESLETAATDQVAVATVSSLDGYSIEDYAIGLARKWALGQKDKDNGLLLLIAPNERKVRIEVGRRLEPIMTDALSKIVIENAILPKFRRGDFSGGIRDGVRDIKAILLGDAEEVKHRAIIKRSPADEWAPIIHLLVFALILALIFYQIRKAALAQREWERNLTPEQRRELERQRRRRNIVVIPGGSGSWGGGWSGGGGGGFSGGGGSFGGGGASGGW